MPDLRRPESSVHAHLPMTGPRNQLPDPLRVRLRHARRRLAIAQVSAGLLLTIAVAATAWLVATGLEAVLWMSPTVRLALVGGLVVTALGLAGYLVLWPMARWFGWFGAYTDDYVAESVGRVFPEVRDRLLNLLQLLDGRHSAAPEPLVAEAARHLGTGLSDLPFDHVGDFGRVKRLGRLASLPIVGLLVFLVAAPGVFLAASARLTAPASLFVRPAPFTIGVEPGDVVLVKGSDLPVAAAFTGTAIPLAALIETRFEGETVVEATPLEITDDRAAHVLVNMRRTLEYRVSAAETSSPWYRATITDRPVLGQMQLLLQYPAYTRLPSQPLSPNAGDVTALRGTRVRINLVASGPSLDSAIIRFASGRETAMEVDGRSVSAEFTVVGNDEWSIDAVSVDGVHNESPIMYRIRALADAPPQVVLTGPEPEYDLDETTIAPLSWRMTDDFGFSSLRLYFRLSGSRFGTPVDTFSVLPLPIGPASEPEQEGSYEWNVAAETALDPGPGDVITYFIEVSDNDAFSGPKSARSAEQLLKVPSIAEKYAALDEEQDRTEDELESLTEDARRIREQFDELREQLQTDTEADWQDQRALERLQQQQEQMERAADDIAQRIEQAADRMERNDLVSEETLEMFRDLQKVAEEMNSPELMEALRNLQQSMEQMNLPQMQQAMEQFEFNEEQYQERLERTLELFKNLRVQQDLDEAQRRAEELARTEEELARQSEKQAERENPAENADPDARNEESAGDPPAEESETDQAPPENESTDEAAERLAEEQERASREMEELEKKLDEIGERMEGVRQAPREEMDQLSKETRSKSMPAQMQENAEKLRDKEFSPAAQEQQDMAQQLRNMQQKLEQMQLGMQGSQLQMNVAGLRRALDDVLSLSADEEALRAVVQDLAIDSPVLRETAQRQLRLTEGLTTVSDSLRSLSREVPEMSRDVQTHAGEALREMADATKAMTDRIAFRAAGHQKGAMTHLNELALLLSDVMDQMLNGQSGGSGSMSQEQLMKQLSEMAGQQKGLNERIQQMLNDMAGNRMTTDMEKRLQQMGEEQARIREQLGQLNRNRDKRNQTLGDLERIAEQMQETIEDLALRQLAPRTIQRQQQILTRLLEASRSLQERGRDRKRESQTGTDSDRSGPEGLTPTERADRLRRDLIRALESGYAPDYEDLIRRYFDLLQQQNGRGSGN